MVAILCQTWFATRNPLFGYQFVFGGTKKEQNREEKKRTGGFTPKMFKGQNRTANGHSRNLEPWNVLCLLRKFAGFLIFALA